MLCQPDELLIIGDSFCAERTSPTDWPQRLLKLTTGADQVPRGIGWPGASWWSTRITLLEELQIKTPKILIICHTEPMRIPSDYHFRLNVATSFSKEPIWPSEEKTHHPINDIKTASQLYFKHLQSEEFHLWAQDRWLRELDALLLATDIRVIHLRSFNSHHVFRSGITSKEILFNLVTESVALPPLINDKPIGPRNHFTTDENVRLADNLYTALCSDLKTGCEYNLGLLR